MKISASDVTWLDSELLEQFENGYKWAVCECYGADEEFQHVHLYNDEDKAFDFYEKDKGGNTLWVQETSVLQKLMQGLSDADKNRDDIDYYIIDTNTCKASRILKTNPDQNPLYNLEGNDFTDELISHFEQQRQHTPISDVFTFHSFDQIKARLNYLGYETDFFLTLEAAMKNGSLKHEECSYDFFGSQMVKYEHQFTKHEDGRWAMDKITGTLYYTTEIDHATVNGIDTEKLDKEMVALNWDIDGHRFLKQNEQTFRSLCSDPIGQLIAVQIFNNHVHPLWLDKPDFLNRVENDLKIYPKMEFSSDKRARDIYDSLNKFKEIENSLERYDIPGVKDTATKIKLIERLVKGESCIIRSDIEKVSKDVEIHWNPRSLKPLFVVEGEVGTDVGKMFEKKTTPEYDSLLQQLREYPFRQLENDTTERRLIESLIEGGKKPIHLEKTFKPGDHIVEFVLIEPNYPDGKGKYFEPIEVYRTSELDLALQLMKQTGRQYNHDDSKGSTSLLLVGQYKGKELQYDRGDMPTVETGYVIATMSEFSPNGNIFLMQGNIKLNNVLSEQVFVERDSATNKLVFTDKYGEFIEIDKDFWSSKTPRHLEKKQVDDEDDLLPKNRINQDKGLSRK